MVDRSQLPTVPVETPSTNGHTLSHAEDRVSIVDELRAVREELKATRMILVELIDVAKRVPFLSKYFTKKG